MVGAEGDSTVYKGGVGFVLGVVEAVGARSCLEFNEHVLPSPFAVHPSQLNPAVFKHLITPRCVSVKRHLWTGTPNSDNSYYVLETHECRLNRARTS